MAFCSGRIGVPHSSDKSCQVGFNDSIRAIFFSRRQRLICFSRAIASRMSPKIWYHTSRSMLYLAVNPSSNKCCFVLTHAPVETVSYADIEVVRSAGENVDGVAMFFHIAILAPLADARSVPHHTSSGPQIPPLGLKSSVGMTSQMTSHKKFSCEKRRSLYLSSRAKPRDLRFVGSRRIASVGIGQQSSQ